MQALRAPSIDRHRPLQVARRLTVTWLRLAPTQAWIARWTAARFTSATCRCSVNCAEAATSRGVRRPRGSLVTATSRGVLRTSAKPSRRKSAVWARGHPDRSKKSSWLPAIAALVRATRTGCVPMGSSAMLREIVPKPNRPLPRIRPRAPSMLGYIASPTYHRVESRVAIFVSTLQCLVTSGP
jgi:hypothetical protein